MPRYADDSDRGPDGASDKHKENKVVIQTPTAKVPKSRYFDSWISEDLTPI